MCSYGGKIQPRSHDNQLSYVGGDTKILAVDRNIKFQPFLSKLSAICDAPPQDITFKYQLPGEELDALISVTNDDDLEHLMHEYDRLYRPSSKPVRMRLFIFTSPNSVFTDPNSIPQPDPIKPKANVDCLFGLDKTLAPPSYAATVPDPVAPVPEYLPRGPLPDQVIGSETVEIQRQLQRMQVAENDQTLYRRRSEDGFSGGYAPAAGGGGGDYYSHMIPENVARSDSPVTVPPPGGYWQEKQFPGDGFPTGSGGRDQPVYMIPAQGGFYQAQMMRPPTAPVTQGYYAVQRMTSDGYREQQVYGGVPPQNAEGYGVVRPAGVPDNAGAGAYAQVAYDSVSGRHVYYTAPAGMVHAPQYQVVSNDMRQAGVLQDVKGIDKSSQG